MHNYVKLWLRENAFMRVINTEFNDTMCGRPMLRYPAPAVTDLFNTLTYTIWHCSSISSIALYYIPVHDHANHLKYKHYDEKQEKYKTKRLRLHSNARYYESDLVEVVVFVEHEAKQNPQEVDEPEGHWRTSAQVC